MSYCTRTRRTTVPSFGCRSSINLKPEAEPEIMKWDSQNRVGQIIYVGKESNRLEEIESGTIHSAQNVYTEYPDPRRDEWQTKIMPVLKKLRVAALIKLSRKSRSMLTRALAGRSIPAPRIHNCSRQPSVGSAQSRGCNRLRFPHGLTDSIFQPTQS